MEFRTENTAERLFCLWCAHSHLFAFVAIGMTPSARPGKWISFRFLKVTARAPGLITLKGSIEGG
jgi:hypothetical protein